MNISHNRICNVFRCDWFYHIAVHSRIKGCPLISRKNIGRHGNDRNCECVRMVMESADRPGCLIPIHPRHQDIHENHVIGVKSAFLYLKYKNQKKREVIVMASMKDIISSPLLRIPTICR